MEEEEQHHAPFNMDADYEGLQEVGGEFFYEKKRKSRTQTRDEALYGYQSSDSDGDGGRFGGGRRGKRGRGAKADYSRPVGFVSSGVIVQQPDGSTQEQQQQQQQGRPGAQPKPAPKQQQQADGGGDGGGSGGAGLGFGCGGGGSGLGFSGGGGGGGLGFVAGGSTGGGGLGFSAAGPQPQGLAGSLLRHQQQQRQQDDDDDVGGGDEDEAAVLPTAFGKRIKAAAEQKAKARAAQASAASARSAARAAHPDIGAFEVHTKGIGLKLLSKMGFTPGQGLGRNKQGIAKPVEAKLRPRGAGMGYGGFQEAKMVLAGDKQGDKEEEDDKGGKGGSSKEAAELQGELAAAAAKLQGPLWKRKAAPARQRRTYRTAEEVLQEGAAAAGPGGEGGRSAAAASHQPILDLRGPTARLVTDLEQLNATDDGGVGGGSGPPMPELAHNLGLLVSLTEAQLRRMDAALQHTADTATLLGREKERLTREAAAAAAASDRLAGLTARLADARQAGDKGASLGQLREAYGSMADAYPEEYRLYSLAAAALAQVLPRMRTLLAGWQVLTEPERGVSEVKAWRRLLEGEGAAQAVLAGGWEDGGDPYATLIAELVMPPIRSAITQWEPRQPEPLLAWCDAWGPLLPRGARAQLLQGLVLPRIAAAVEGWDPTRETQPIHTWLHPWLPYLATELAGVYPTIRHRLSRALAAWHASDGSARILLAPWAAAFEPADWEALTARCIVPKLAHALQTELVLHPLEPQLEPFDWALAWHGLLPAQQLAGLLEAAFFPPWLAILHHWLSAAPDFDEVTRWYLEWKGRFPQDVLDQPRVRAGFAAALDMMNAAADGRPLPAPAAAAAAPPGVPSWRREVEQQQTGLQQPSQGVQQQQQKQQQRPGGAGGGEPSFRDLVGRYASEAGLDFVPRAGRLHDGLPVYSFGGVSCVVDSAHGVVRAALRGRGWAAVSLEQLKQEALGR